MLDVESSPLAGCFNKAGPPDGVVEVNAGTLDRKPGRADFDTACGGAHTRRAQHREFGKAAIVELLNDAGPCRLRGRRGGWRDSAGCREVELESLAAQLSVRIE